MKTSRILPVAILMLVGLSGGCASVSEGPSGTPVSGQATMRGVEPEHAPIKTKDVPKGESSLRHSRPD